MRPPDRVPSPDPNEWEEDIDNEQKQHKKAGGGVGGGAGGGGGGSDFENANSDWSFAGHDADEEPAAKKRKDNRTHTDTDSKSEFKQSAPDDGPEYNWGAAANGLGEEQKGAGSNATSNKVYIPLDELDERLKEYEKVPEEKRWCPMCAITALSSRSTLTKEKVSLETEIREIDGAVEKGLLGSWKTWAWTVKALWDKRIRHHIYKNAKYGLREDHPEWTIDSILYHYCKETINERRIEGFQIRDMFLMLNSMKTEMREKKPDGTTPLNGKLLPAWLSYSKELRSRLREFRGSR
jgi:hypothetical protein